MPQDDPTHTRRRQAFEKRHQLEIGRLLHGIEVTPSILARADEAALVRSCGSSRSAASVEDAVIFALTFVCVHYAIRKPIAASLQAR
jgi:hypothetical protein